MKYIRNWLTCWTRCPTVSRQPRRVGHRNQAIAAIEGVFDKYDYGRKLIKDAAYALIHKYEEKALVHLTWNVTSGHYFICNCCGCCCGVLRSINGWNIPFFKTQRSNPHA